MNKTLIIVLVLVLVLVGGYFLMGKGEVEAPLVEEQNSVDNSNGAITNTMPAGDNTGVDEMLVGGDAVAPGAESVKEFTVEGKNFSFAPSTMTVKKGDKVKITFKNSEGFHDFKIDEYGVATKQAKAPAEEVLEFTADKVGSFEYYCSVGQHKAMGMKGVLVVE